MKPIRILHMIGSLNVGGSQTMMLNLYRAIDKSKIQFDFIIDHEDELAFADDVRALGSQIYVMPRFTFTNIKHVKDAWDRFFKEHPEYRILHSHVRSYASVYLPIAKKHGVKTIIHSHSTSNGSGMKALVKAVMQYPLRYQADYFFSCSEEAGKWLFGKRIASDSRHYVLKNAIDAAAYRYSEEIRAEYRKNLNLEGKQVYIHVGRFHPAKNHAFLLDVFKRIHECRKNSVLLLVGDGDLRERIEAQIEQHDLSEAVVLLGNRKDISKILQAADCFLFPSLWEGLGIVAVEAQAAGLPCICSDQVPGLVKVTDECKFLPLDAKLWAKEAMAVSSERRDTYNEIAAAGYDIRMSVGWLQNFYIKVSDKQYD